MKSLILTVFACALLAGCAATPEWGWKRTDGQSAREDPALRTQFEHDKAGCIGETQQAGLVGAAGGRGSGGGTMHSLRDHEAMDLVKDCMARKGYAVAPHLASERAQTEATTK